MMKIDENLNLVLPLGDLHVYHMPISRAVFEANYKIIGMTKAELASRGIYFEMGSGPRIATLTLMDVSREVDKESKGIALLAEIKRLSMVLAPSASGWDMIPVDTAIARGLFDDEDWLEVQSALVFFMSHYSLAKKADRQSVMIALASLLLGSSTLFNCSEFAASLPKSMTAESIGVPVASAVPR